MLASFPLVLGNNETAFHSDPREYVSFLNTHFLLNLKTTIKHLFLSVKGGEEKGALLFSGIPAGFRGIKE